MAKKTQLDLAIDNLQREIDAKQMALKVLQEQRETLTPRRRPAERAADS
jgi:hypothetical protein